MDAEVDLHVANGAYSLGARLNISLPGIAREIAQELLKEALRLVHTAPRSNIDVTIKLI